MPATRGSRVRAVRRTGAPESDWNATRARSQGPYSLPNAASESDPVKQLSGSSICDSMSLDDRARLKQIFETLHVEFFWDNPHASDWSLLLKAYAGCVRKMSESSARRKPLLTLDNWYNIDLPAAIESRKPGHIELEELCKIVEWKLARGKFRPRLLKLAGANEGADVVAITTEAFRTLNALPSLDSAHQVKNVAETKVATESMLRVITEALELLCRLKGLGPATATYVAASCRPDIIPCMSDEALAVATGNKSPKYSMAEFRLLFEAVFTKAKALQTEERDKKMTARQVRNQSLLTLNPRLPSGKACIAWFQKDEAQWHRERHQKAAGQALFPF